MASLKDLFKKIPINRTEVDRIPVDTVPNPTPTGLQGKGVKDLASGLWGTVKTHPWKAAGASLLGGMNTIGLFDNSQMGGQIIGGLGGAAIPLALNALAKTNISPYWTAMSSMGGGALGALFDRLIANKKDGAHLSPEEEAYILNQAKQGGFYTAY